MALPEIKTVQDGSAGLLDAELRTLAVSKKLPFHFASFSAVKEHLPRYFAPDELAEGDVLFPVSPTLECGI